eukprot:5860290-Pyramimonas_sp.AAC.1
MVPVKRSYAFEREDIEKRAQYVIKVCTPLLSICNLPLRSRNQCCPLATWQWRAPLVVGECATGS